MNAYLSREEKENFIRATALAAQLQDTIDGYAKAKSTDPEFLKYLRTGRTMVAKALTMRADALDMDTKIEFAKQLSRMELIFIPTLEAKKAHLDLLALKTTLPMELHDFEDWYESVIETTCKRCLREDYADCKTRRVLAKYGVYPIDPGAEGKCQYSYIGTPEQEELQPANTETVPAEIYNLAVSQLAAAQEKTRELNNAIESHEDIIKDLNFSLGDWAKQYAELEAKLAKVDNLASIEQSKFAEACSEILKLQQQLADMAALQEQPKEEYPVSIGLASGGEFEYVLPAGMTEAMIREIQQPRHSRSTCAQYAGGRLVAIDLQEVVAIHVDKLPQGDWVKKKATAEFSAPAPAPSEQERYRIECKCGAEYFVGLSTGKTKAWCRDCQTAVFVDKKAEVKTADGKPAILLTNRYWVERDQKPSEQPAPPIRQNFSRGYKDPCNPFE